MAMARLTVLMGAPGAGKSTWARGACAGEVVSTDRARANFEDSGDAMRGAYRRLHELLAAGEDAVFDTTAATPNIRKAALGIARRYEAEVDLHVFDPPVEACVSAQRGRAHPVPEDRVRRYHADVRRQIPGLSGEGFDDVRVTRRLY